MPDVDPQRWEEAVQDRRFAAQAQLGKDKAEIATWDPRLSRRTRILVPVDVQALVVPADGGEPLVPLTGGADDPPPFDPGTARPPGVHLHWAMPDALLAGSGGQTGSELELPALPDRWVVVRTLQPVGARQVRLRGWVVDAPTGSTTPLEEYTGTPAPAPDGVPVLDPLNGSAGGSLLWTASYTASAGRLTFHDPLDDLGGDPLAGNQACYTVAGWWSSLDADPLADALGGLGLDRLLNGLGWWVVHDEYDDALVEEDPRLARLRSGMGLKAPVETPPTTITGADGRVVSGALDAVMIIQPMPVDRSEQVVVLPTRTRYATLLHGSVLGVPVDGSLPVDDRPAPDDLGLGIGQDTDDVVAALGASVLGLDPARRDAAETLVAAFTSGMIEEVGTPDGLEDLAEREHGDGFWPLPGAPLPNAKPDRLRAEDAAAAGPLAVGRKGRAATRREPLTVQLEWVQSVDLKTVMGMGTGVARARAEEARPAAIGKDKTESRDLIRPAPRYFRPQAPMVALRGAHPSHRHHGDGLFDESGRLRCRYPRECVPELQGVVTGAAVVPSLGSGAVPDEVLTVVREAVLLNPYGYAWLAAAGAPPTPAGGGPLVEAFRARIAAEMVRLYGTDGRYDGASPVTAAPGTPGGPPPAGEALSAAAASPWSRVSAQHIRTDLQVSAVLAEHSLVKGVPPSPVAITTWRQPWVPLWAEWQVTLRGRDAVAGWDLSGLDLEPADATPPPAAAGSEVVTTLAGRSILGRGVSTTLHAAIQRWLETERSRDATADPTLPPSDQDLLTRLDDLLVPLDLVSASLDGVREQLLGIPYVGVVDRGTGTEERPPQATSDPIPLFAGTLQIDRLRLVDAFGRVLEVPPEALAATVTTSHLAVDGLPAGMRLRPRVQHKARWLFRLVDPAQPGDTLPAELREAFVDQLDPAAAVNPVAGFLLPDHIDESLEAFTVDGTPIGEVGHDAVTGAVTWEPAPGLPLPPDAGPLQGLDQQARIVGEIVAGLVQADAAARNAGTPPPSSTLSALLRAVDTTLWTVDTFAAVGSSTVAGLVGRPIAVVRASLTLDAPDDLDEVEVVAPAGPEARQAAFAAMREQRFPVRLGTLTRSDDALLGFYVDDDYAHLRLVDKVVAAQALDSGRLRGHLGLLGSVTTPTVEPLHHPYVVPDGTLWLRPGQTARLTLLMLPVGRVHLTSGILPRKQLALADDWVTAGLRRLVPSVRVGPVLVDPAEIRLPLVTLLGDQQTFTRRTGPLTWRDDPIVAATQTAYLPRLPHEAQEGWVRVTPGDAAAGGDGTAGTEAAP
jgi:hypothetical protein